MNWLLVSAVLCGLVASCSEKKPEVVRQKATPSIFNEVIALSPKAMARERRAPKTQVANSTILAPLAETSIDPGEDWRSEERSRQATTLLQKLVEGESIDMLTEDFKSTMLKGSTLDLWDINKMSGMRMASFPQPEALLDTEEFLAQLAQFQGWSESVELKPVGVEISQGDDGDYTTQTRLEWLDASAEAHTTWECVWSEERLVRLRVLSYESVSCDDEPLYEDVTRSVLKPSPLIDHSIEFWNERITRYGDMYLTGHHGLAVGDVNGDGLEDVYVCDGGSLPNQLYLQQADGSAVEAAAKAGVDFLEDSRGALLVDLDNDGDQDLVVATVALIIMAENDGAGNFTLRGGHPGAPYPASISAADPDNDGDLDLYVCVYEAGDQLSSARWFAARSPVPFNDANNGGRNVLLGNVGHFQFADITADFGLEDNNQRWSFAAGWEDYDQDGDVDLAVANDFGRNNLYRNDGGIFTDIAAEAGVEDMAAGMSVTWGDANRDGYMDLYVGNMFSSAGNRISYQRQFAANREPSGLAGVQRMARGNSLFLAKPDGSGFTDVSEQAGVTMGRWAWSSGFVDMNNDGWQDLVVANGYLTNTRDMDL